MWSVNGWPCMKGEWADLLYNLLLSWNGIFRIQNQFDTAIPTFHVMIPNLTMDGDSRLKPKIRRFLVAQIRKEKAVTERRHEKCDFYYEWNETLGSKGFVEMTDKCKLQNLSSIWEKHRSVFLHRSRPKMPLPLSTVYGIKWPSRETRGWVRSPTVFLPASSESEDITLFKSTVNCGGEHFEKNLPPAKAQNPLPRLYSEGWKRWQNWSISYSLYGFT